MKRCTLSFLILASIAANAAQVDSVTIYSQAMKKGYKCIIISPAQDKNTALPVVYLLHGFSGDYGNWFKRVPELKNYADQYKLMIVCPDGGYSSWYFDSPVDSAVKFETYIGKEVPEYIDAHYNTIRDRKGRAITGLSMGGHGGLFLAFRHPDKFGACGSMSGGVNLNSSRNKFDIIKRIGDTVSHADNWKKYSVINLIDKAPAQPLRIIFDCGTEDFFYKDNHDLHEKMVKLKISHDYIERPGQHNWAYWSNSIKYQLLFFSDYFAGK